MEAGILREAGKFIIGRGHEVECCVENLRGDQRLFLKLCEIKREHWKLERRETILIEVDSR